MLQHLAKGRVDLVLGRGNTVPVYPWFGQDIHKGLELALENYNLLHRLWREDVVDWEGGFRAHAQGRHHVHAGVAGDSAFIAPKQKSFSFKVTAKKGSKLYFYCAVHAWMQGKITVN
jgi:hypothetical protein